MEAVKYVLNCLSAMFLHASYDGKVTRVCWIRGGVRGLGPPAKWLTFWPHCNRKSRSIVMLVSNTTSPNHNLRHLPILASRFAAELPALHMCM